MEIGPGIIETDQHLGIVIISRIRLPISEVIVDNRTSYLVLALLGTIVHIPQWTVSGDMAQHGGHLHTVPKSITTVQ
jgi:hypothetical protein